jgi:hypothetical protein
VPGHFDFRRGSERGIFEGEVEIVSKVRPTLHSRAAASRTEHVPEPEEIAKNVAEIGEHVGVETAEAARGGA